jgi:nitrite reductase/ring-hydroxylating ferredoxin subunit
LKEYLVCKEADIPEGGSITVKAGKRNISVFKISGEFYAINDYCSHKGASLCQGIVDTDNKVVRCPWHLWDWSLESGHLEAYSKKRQPIYKTDVINGEVLLYVN